MITNGMVSMNDYVVQVKGNIVSDMGGEKVMLSIQNGKYYNLGEMGGIIWDLVEVPISIGQLITTLMTEYDVEQSECQRQVVSFLGHLLEEGLVHLGADVHRE
ncbi:lasso peptide biosynthesis PqqD family chaperone [Paenibacillus sp. GCM10023248]|uniref:lasso peptide biosynthesis PqqD family chaperone n=1 Tax=unclassified Paenibacillus TaxID=185978 RepID=UPI002379E404|nr:lasso peptide biosynthesis PqqD family chaperone [Paenibacillus sp. MAHUQ-63]MDD9266536.1 lasso peptide biosynthesis PqqD family chaperone [Paenibacillus sp. MAHUQ-63]